MLHHSLHLQCHDTLRKQKVQVIAIDYTTIILYRKMVGGNNRKGRRGGGNSLYLQSYIMENTNSSKFHKKEDNICIKMLFPVYMVSERRG